MNKKKVVKKKVSKKKAVKKKDKIKKTNPEFQKIVEDEILPEMEKLITKLKDNGISIVTRIEAFDAVVDKHRAWQIFLPSDQMSGHQGIVGDVLSEERMNEFAESFKERGAAEYALKQYKAEEKKSNIIKGPGGGGIILPGQ
jgi:hypothetical protein